MACSLYNNNGYGCGGCVHFVKTNSVTVQDKYHNKYKNKYNDTYTDKWKKKETKHNKTNK